MEQKNKFPLIWFGIAILISLSISGCGISDSDTDSGTGSSTDSDSDDESETAVSFSLTNHRRHTQLGRRRHRGYRSAARTEFLPVVACLAV